MAWDGLRSVCLGRRNSNKIIKDGHSGLLAAFPPLQLLVTGSE